MPKLTYLELVKQKIRDDAVLKSIGDGLLVVVDVDKGGKIIYANNEFEHLTGWRLKEILNKSVVSILPREDKDGKIVHFKDRIVSKVLAGEKIVTDLASPFYYIRKDKSRFPVASVITPILVKNKIIGAVETFRDISKEVAADKAKTEFASLVSHQLRTPFSTINWYIELLLSEDVGKLNEKQTQYLEEVYRASKRMVNLINVLLSISRIEMGTAIFEKRLTDIVNLAEIILKEDQPEIQKKRIKVSKLYDKNIPKIHADPKQMSMIFQNLLSNAIKYTSNEGKITLKIEKQKDDILIAIEDTGMGIPESAKDKIFTRFFRAKNAKVRDAEGTGLGLYILKTIIDQMNGKIWFDSIEGKGTTFYVSLPQEEVKK